MKSSCSALNIAVELGEMLSRLAPVDISAPKESLHTLLEDEKLHGTRERDLTAPRPDFYYFKPGSKHLLVEDATAKHRPIMVKEYAHSQKDGPDWPILFDGFLRVSSSMQTATPVEKIRQRAWSLYVDRVPFEGEQPPAELKRSISLRSISGTPKLPDAQPYQNASGNSVVITSNIASTSNANHSPAFLGGLTALGTHKDRAIMQMSKRVQVLKGNAQLAAAKRQHSDLNLTSIPSRRASTGQMPPPKTFMTQDQVISMLQQAREPVREPQPTVAQRIRNREKVEAGLKGKEQDTAPGYCENCRLRYENLSAVSLSPRLPPVDYSANESIAYRIEKASPFRDQQRKLRGPRRPLVDARTTDQPDQPYHGMSPVCGAARQGRRGMRFMFPARRRVRVVRGGERTGNLERGYGRGRGIRRSDGRRRSLGWG